jgi:alginate O-acetyltransferase complex protein AlgJ
MTSLLATTALGCLIPSRALADEPLVYIGKDGWLFPSWEHGTGIPQDWVDNGLSLIGRARDVLAHNGIKLYVSMVPSKGLVYPEFLPPNVVPTAEFMGRYHHALDYFNRNGIPATNVLDAMLAAKAQNQQYMKTDSHWTNFGSELAAAQTAKSYGIVSPPVKPVPNGVPIPGGTSEMLVAGDLVPLLPAAKQAGYKHDPFLVRQFTLGGGVEPKAYSVALVGPSSLKPNMGFPGIFSHLIGRPVDLYWKLGSIGQWRTLTQYYGLVKKSGKKPPKALVWQFSDYVLGAGPDAVAAWGSENTYASADAWLADLRTLTQS